MAQEIGDNNLIDTWASGGDVIEPSPTKKDQGWTLGEKPPHEFMNYLQNEFGKQLNYLMRSGVAAHNVATNYLANDIVTSGGSVWIALANNTNSVPSSVNTNWRRIITVADIPDASETVKGLIEHATQAEVNAGTAGNFAVTPPKLRFGFQASFTSNGYIKFPSWLGGFTLQWGTVVNSGVATTANFPTGFPTACLHVFVSARGANTFPVSVFARPLSATQFEYASQNVDENNISYLAIGY